MRTDPAEPMFDAWEPLDEPALSARVQALLPPGLRLILVDGRSGSGKSTFAAKLARILSAPIVHIDDISWWLHPIDWVAELRDGVLNPWSRGEPVRYRPPGWVAKNRPGAVEAPPSDTLIVEGVGAGRRELAAHASLVVWVQSDTDEARRRGILRDVAQGRSRAEAEEFWDAWLLDENPFLDADRPWTRAALIVNGTPPEGTRETLVSGAPNGRAPDA